MRFFFGSNKANKIRQQILENPSVIDKNLVKKKDWIAIPQDFGIFSSESLWNGIYSFSNSGGLSKIIAVDNEDRGSKFPFEVEPRKEAVLAFFEDHFLEPLLITDNSLNFAVLRVSPIYNIYAGPRRFIESSLELSPPAAISRLHAFIATLDRNAPWVINTFNSLLEYYELPK